MILNLLAGILTGFNNEINEGNAIGLGGAFMDFFYCLLAFGGISLIISFFPSAAAKFYNGNTFMIEMVLTFLGSGIVIIYGFKIIRTKVTFDKLEAEESNKIESALVKASKLGEKAKSISKNLKVPEITKSNTFGLFFMGVLLCMSSLTLPASWIAIVGYLKGYNLLNSSLLGGLLFSAGAFAGTFSWFYLLLKLITANKQRINKTTINKLNIIAGIILLMLGVSLFTKAVISVFNIL